MLLENKANKDSYVKEKPHETPFIPLDGGKTVARPAALYPCITYGINKT